MFFSRSIIAYVLLGCAAAKTHAGEGAGASATDSAVSGVATGVPGMVNTHVVQVGGPNGSLTFSPENVVAAPGDLVQFQFWPKNHSVVQSTFDQPCIPIQNVMPNKTDAFYSGFMPSNATAVAAGNVLTYTIRVKDAKPIWFYCSQGQHCQNGMVGAINAAATGNKSMEAFKALAKVATENVSPGQAPGQGNPSQFPSGGAENTATAGTSGTASGGAASPTAPLEQPVNAAARAAQSIFGLAVTALAAILIL